MTVSLIDESAKCTFITEEDPEAKDTWLTGLRGMIGFSNRQCTGFEVATWLI